MIDEQGSPIDGAFVSATPLLQEGEVESSSASAETGESGSFSLEHLPAGGIRLFVGEDGYVSLHREIELIPGDVRDLGAVVLQKGRSIAGRVVDASGEPVPGALVGRRESGPVSRHHMLFHGGQRCDERGEFQFDGLEPGRWLVWASAGPKALRSPWVATVIDVREGDALDVEIELGFSRSWSAVVADSAGHDVESWEILLRGTDQPWAQYADVGLAGELEARVGPGRFLVALLTEGGERWISAVEPGEDLPPVPEGRLVLEADGGIADPPASLRLTYLDGQLPAELLPVHASCEEPRPGQRRVDLRHLPPGRYRLRASWGNSEDESFDFTVRRDRVTREPWPFEGPR